MLPNNYSRITTAYDDEVDDMRDDLGTRPPPRTFNSSTTPEHEMEEVTPSRNTHQQRSSQDMDEVTDEENDSPEPSTSLRSTPMHGGSGGSGMSIEDMQRLATYTPLRLLESERVILGVVEGALEHSEYTDNVDVSRNMHYVSEVWNKDQRIVEELNEFAGVIIGLSVANGIPGSKTLLKNSLEANGEYIGKCMEIGRRFKILNPDKMRSTYGKLLYMLMDTQRPETRRALGFNLVKNVDTVATLLTHHHCERMLEEPDVDDATREIVETDPTQSTAAAQRKAQAIQRLAQVYGPQMGDSSEQVRRVLSSLEDARSFLRSNRDPVQQMLDYLMQNFHPNKESRDPRFSLSLQGRKGAKHELTHDHRTQFVFVQQSLMLWKRVMDQFFQLWSGAEDDLLSSRNGYQLTNTGQGMQRCQNAPTTRRNMGEVLYRVHRETKHDWVGLAVVHLGDREVPNALVFIDKYTQVPRILGPVVRCLQYVSNVMRHDPAASAYLKNTFGGVDECIKTILGDIFRGGFDGGGDLGGSCIDGRLTSLWNWSSLIEKKSYYPVFLLSGFLGFDGDFR